MTSWQRRARFGVLVFGVTVAAVVYFGFRARQPLASREAVPRLDAKAVWEITQGVLQRVRGNREDVVVTARRSVTYDDGVTEHFDVRLTSRNREGRDFFVEAPKGRVTKDNARIELAGGVRLTDSSGFALSADRGEYDRTSGLVRAPGSVTFSKGRMSGSGDGMSYDHGADVLRIDDRAQVTVTGETVDSRMHFTAGAMTLDRLQDMLVLERNVHAVRGEQVTDADVATVSLTPEEDTITFVQLRGNARVQGGAGSLESMRARDIDLDYTEDGETLERALLMGGGSVALRGQRESPGREFSAGVLDASLAPDGSVTLLVGEQNVVMALAGSPDAPARSVSSDKLEASGSGGQSLTNAGFSGNVYFRETASGGGAARVVRSRLLMLDMSGEQISSARFTGGVTVQEDDLSATAAEARYEPDHGRLHLGGSEANRLPTVADEELRVEAQTIEIALDTRALDARGRVKTVLTPEAATPSERRRARTSEPSRLPGLLAPDRAVNVTASRLLHEGEGGTAHFSGSAWLWQGDTEIRAESIDIDQKSGDLVARGGARSVLEFESGKSDGRAYEIRYADSTRVVTYASPPQGTHERDEASPRLRGSQGDLAAERIEIVLASTESRVERIEGYAGVTAQVDSKTIKGHRFTYQQAADRYEVSGTPAKPLSVQTESCRENSGSTLTFDRSTDTMTIDGRTVRTQTKNTCREPASH